MSVDQLMLGSALDAYETMNVDRAIPASTDADSGGTVPAEPNKLRKRLDVYAFAIACFISAIISLILVLLDKKLTTESLLSALGINIGSSIVFAVVFTFFSTRVQERNLLDTLDEKFGVQDQKLAEHMHALSVQYVPSRTYLAGPEFDRQFNSDLSDNLTGSRTYGFRGTSAKYVPARLRHCNHPPTSAQIVMLDPRDDGVLRRRAVQRKRHLPNITKPVEDLVDEIRDEILMSMVALFDARDICPIQILLVDRPIITRMEIVDKAVYLSWYQGPTSPAHPFPETVRFDVGSFIFETEQLGLAASFEESGRILRFDTGLDDSRIVSSISGYSSTPITDAEVIEWRRKYEKFIVPFDQLLKSL